MSVVRQIGVVAGGMLLALTTAASAEPNVAFADFRLSSSPIAAPLFGVARPPVQQANEVATPPDYRIRSTELGFAQGIAPAPGRTLLYRRLNYRVAEVVAEEGGPVFSGGSLSVIAPSGGSLIVSLKEVPPDRDGAGAASVGAAQPGSPVPVDWNSARPMQQSPTGGAPI